jgi:DNA-3-methyladenine glycosylase II
MMLIYTHHDAIRRESVRCVMIAGVAKTFSIVPRGPFSLAAANGFGFGGREAGAGDVMRLAFAADGTGAPVGVVLRQDAGGTVHGDVQGDVDADAVAEQVARILSLDHDGEHWRRIGREDPPLGALQDAYPGQRPVLFHSPYEAACHAIVSARRSPRQVTEAKRRLGHELGGSFTLGGEELTAFPGPEALLDGLAPLPGVDEERVRRLRGIAEAAAQGRLDAERLRLLGPEAATEELLGLRGIGPFSAALIVVRATGLSDVVPTDEPGARQAARTLLGLGEVPDPSAFWARAEAWRPFRTWALVLLRLAGHRQGLI